MSPISKASNPLLFPWNLTLLIVNLKFELGGVRPSILISYNDMASKEDIRSKYLPLEKGRKSSKIVTMSPYHLRYKIKKVVKLGSLERGLTFDLDCHVYVGRKYHIFKAKSREKKEVKNVKQQADCGGLRTRKTPRVFPK